MEIPLIIGASGKVGSRLLAALERRGAEPRSAGRSRGDVRFDWTEEATWGPALEGATGLFVVGPGSARDWSGSLARLLELAAKAGVGQAVLLSARAVEFLPEGNVARAEAAMSAGPLPATILRPSHFSQNFSEAMFQPVDGVITAPAGEGAEPFIDVADIAEVAALALAERRLAGEILELSGPAALSFEECAAILSRLRGEEIVYVPQNREDHVAELRADGTPEPYVEWRMAMLDAIRSDADAYLSDGVERALSRAPRSFAAALSHRDPDGA